jgi:ribosome biogenesis protein Tsr3
MKEIREKIERQRRIIDNLIMAAAVRRDTYGKTHQFKEVDALTKTLEILGTANHYLWLATVPLGD